MKRSFISNSIDYNLVTHNSVDSLISYEYGCHIGADDPTSVDPNTKDGVSADFAEFATYRAKDLVEEKITALAQAIDENDDTICLYRGLYVSQEWIEGDLSDRPIGMCWSWDYEFAIAHHMADPGNGEPIDVRVVGLVKPSDIDWNATVILAVTDEYVTGEEREVRLRPDARIAIAGVDWRPASCDNDPFEPVPRFETCGILIDAGTTVASPLKMGI